MPQDDHAENANFLLGREIQGERRTRPPENDRSSPTRLERIDRVGMRDEGEIETRIPARRFFIAQGGQKAKIDIV